MDKMGKEKTEDEEMEDFRDGGKSQDIDEMDEIENTSCNCWKIMVMLIAISTLVCQDTFFHVHIKVHYYLLLIN